MKIKKINPAVSEYYRQLGKKSAKARLKKIMEKVAEKENSKPNK